jgi:hypothetical protein
MGSRDLTDGIRVWPQGFAHYVEEHEIALPEAFLHTMAAHGWRMPEGLETRIQALRSDASGYDLEPWRKWAIGFRPWYAFW